MMKCHKENRLPRIIAPGCNTAVENLSHWVKDQLKPLDSTSKYHSKDTNDVIFWLKSLNQKYALSPWYVTSIIDNVPEYNAGS